MLAGVKIVDCDTHVTEAPDMFTSRAPAKFKGCEHIRETDRRLDRHGLPDRSHVVPDTRQLDTPPHRELHEHRMFGVRAEMTVTVLLDRSNLVDLVLAQSICRQPDGAVAEREAGHDRQHHDADRGSRDRDQTVTCIAVPVSRRYALDIVGLLQTHDSIGHVNGHADATTTRD